MTLSEKLKISTPSQSGLPCGMGKLMSSLTEKDREALEQVLFTNDSSIPRISNTKIYQILVEEGYQVAPSSIAQHRRKQCRCFIGVQKI